MQTTDRIEAPSRTVENRAAPVDRRRFSTVSCPTCREPLHYPLPRRTGVPRLLFCSRCGGQTPAPTVWTRLLKVATVVFGIIALWVVGYSLKHREGATVPTAERMQLFDHAGE